MANSQLIEALGYRDSRKFLSATEADRLPASELSFAIRHTAQVCEGKSEAGEDCSFLGTYILQEQSGAPAVPVVYVFETDSDSTAKAIHRIVWNQNLVPFLIVASRSTVRVYPGFSFSRDADNALISVANIAAVYHHHIGLNTWESKGGSPPPPGTTGLYHLAILYPTRSLLADALRRVLGANIELDAASNHGVSEALYLRDPDGNGVELYYDRPVSEWPRAANGELAMFTHALDLTGPLKGGT